MKKILVTGGAGFIASNFIIHYLKNHPDCVIINLDKLTYCANLENLKEVESNSNYIFVKGDIADQELVSALIEEEKPDCIINFAAESHVDNSISDPVIFTKTNVLGTNILLECARKSNIKKFIQISTDEVYGSIREGVFTEGDKLRPNSPYAASKAAADLIVRSFIKTYNFPAITIRASNNFGPRQNTEKFIPLAITNLLKDKKIPLYGDGKNIREWIYVDDTCEAIDMITEKGVFGEIYNVGSGEEKTNIEVATTLQKEITNQEDMIEFVEDRKGHDFRYYLNSEKTRKLGWKPRHNFQDAVLKTIDWYKNNREWWESN